jgi:hypothetical protein
MRSVLFALSLAVCANAETRLGKPFSLAKPMSVDQLMANPAPLVGKTVQVTGRITEVCEKMGCWLNLVDVPSSKQIRFKVKDGEITIPGSGVGKIATAEGKLLKFELTREQAVARARHEAEEQGRKFEPGTIKTGAVVYQIQGEGVLITD